jgi:FlaA1/EpsC-like NDP-sugar epimerase
MSAIPSRPALASNGHIFNFFVKKAQLILDVTWLALAFVISCGLRFDFELPPSAVALMPGQLVVAAGVQFAFLYVGGIHKFIWRYISIGEVKKFVAAALWSAALLLMLRAFFPKSHLGMPISVIVIDTCLAFGGALGMRVLRRGAYERRRRKLTSSGGARSLKRVLLIGAGRAGVLTAAEARGRGDLGVQIVGFVDDDRSKVGSTLQGLKVLGTSADLPRLVRDLDIDHLIISIAQASRQEFRRILDICESIPVRVRVIPSLSEIMQGNVKVSRIRDVEIEDLLGRQPVQLDDRKLSAFLSGKTVMVTGAGGSIGSELVRQAVRFGPARILLVERAEFALFNIEREMRAAVPGVELLPLIADVSDEPRMRTIFSTYAPQVVLHAAAHKHVPMMETNPCEAVKNNVLGTSITGELAGEHGVETFVLISTDKAVRPTSVMGATKRVAELAVQGLDHRYETKFVAVRFGNVIGSAGSVIPIFRDQILKGGPVTVTHPDMVRYFMTIPEASQLVLQAGAMGEGGEIFVLDMGEPVKILDLAKETIRLSGLRPFEDIDIMFTGIRPGEKLFEELQAAGEDLALTRHPKIFIGKIAGLPPERVVHSVQRLGHLARNGWETEIRNELNEMLPEAKLQYRSPDLVPLGSVMPATRSAAGAKS